MRRLIALLVIALASGTALGLLWLTGALERLELLTHDARVTAGLGRKDPDPRIVVAWIDQESMDYMRRNGVSFPWPRSVYKDVLQYLSAGGARLAVFDVLFSEPQNAEDDVVLGTALQLSQREVLAFKFINWRDGGFTPEETGRLVQRGLEVGATDDLPAAVLNARAGEGGAVLPIPELEQSAALLGYVNVRSDADKAHRHVDVLRTWRGTAYPSLALAAAMFASGERMVRVADDTLVLGNQRVPLCPGGRIALNFRRPKPVPPEGGYAGSFEHVKFVNILESINLVEAGKEPLYPAKKFKDRIVVIGINAEGYEDVTPTPISALFSGPELHATAIDNLLNGDALVLLRYDAALTVLATLAGAAVVLWLPAVALPVLALLALALAFGGVSALAFAQGMLVPTTAPLLGLAFSGGGGLLYRLLVEGKQKRELRKAFTTYMAPEIVEEVLRDPGRIQLGGQLREITVLFSDLAGFTSYSEAETPQAVVAFLNDYFTRMCDRIMLEAGVIDKFIGDAIMALFGAPVNRTDHAAAAVRAALADLAEMQRLNAELAARNQASMTMRIGIHTGPAVVGNMGSSRRFDYTAIGDTVNLASRLEGACKHFGICCLVSEHAWRAASGAVRGREIGLVRVAGRATPVRVFEPTAVAGDGAASERAADDAYGQALAALRSGDRGAAERGFAEVARLRPADRVVAMYREHLAAPEWDGVFTLSK